MKVYMNSLFLKLFHLPFLLYMYQYCKNVLSYKSEMKFHIGNAIKLNNECVIFKFILKPSWTVIDRNST